ncbi:Extracellular protein SEL-1 and related proteins [Plasmopara halstedii]|uniref:Extracellular protein SEL-1 and related proteins n=1 Tax=Plasmopara halstedii TaxID=4781 RepID=A0A0P1AYM4_PLAHL|nr:Extracellular protein SEL-1 and related proteins [Plasmopara halstedii]CEG46770.1 Extracellular protein SEL-1 and related proteins [Plasmopara halstedii]|eukprot:XP_024583139.1 Extracellular protein SEL-1 and related proteins [Plasmopara halstedii]
MVRLYGCSIALLSAIAFASTSFSEEDVGTEKSTSHSPNDVYTASAQKVASWEVQPDGSAITKDSKSPSPLSAKAQIRRDENGKWIVVPYEKTVGLDVISSPQLPQAKQAEAIEAENDVDVVEKATDSMFLTPSKSFLALEARIANEGYTSELMDELVRISQTYEDPPDQRKGNDWAFAVTHMSLRQLFRPNSMTKEDQVFIDAIFNLKIAADYGAQVAREVIAMLDLIGVPDPDELDDPNLPPLSREERRLEGIEALQSLASFNDSMAMLTVAYGTLSGEIPAQSTDLKILADSDAVCEAAATLYRKCADHNVYVIAAEGNERFPDIVRLSGRSRSSAWDVIGLGGLDYESQPLALIEHYLTIANDPMDKEYLRAMLYLGDLYFSGDPAAHIAPDQRLAAQYYRRAAEAGSSAAQANYGMVLAKGMGVVQDYAQAIMYLNRAAKKNNSFAFFGLGELYFRGYGVPQNVSLALSFFNEALSQGYALAHSFLGSIYLHGQEGVPIDHNKALYHYKAAVNATGGKASQPLHDLAGMHYHGYGTPRSCAKALPLFRSVALHHDINSNFPFSHDKAYECYKKEDYLRAYLQYRLIAELGDVDAQCNAAYLLEHHGDSIFKWRWLALSARSTSNPLLHEAFTLYSQAAALNDSEAIRKTGICYHEPWDGVCPSNRTEAFKRYQLAAELGDAQAGHNCGLMLLTGDGIPQNMTAARSHFVHCSNANFPANVPCALVLLGLGFLQSIKTLVGWI